MKKVECCCICGSDNIYPAEKNTMFCADCKNYVENDSIRDARVFFDDIMTEDRYWKKIDMTQWDVYGFENLFRPNIAGFIIGGYKSYTYLN